MIPGEGEYTRAQEAECGLRAVLAGGAPLAAAAHPLLGVEPDSLVLSALKPGEASGTVVRVLNPTNAPVTARLTPGFPCAGVQPVRLDEEPAAFPLAVRDGVIELEVPPHALRSVLILP